MPHHLKYVEAHSGTTLDRPSRAKARTSSNASQGFFARLRRSARWALVSFTGTASVIFSSLGNGVKQKARGSRSGCIAGFRKPWNYEWSVKKPKSPLRAKRHTAATTGATMHTLIFAGGKRKSNKVIEPHTIQSNFNMHTHTS